MCAGASGQRMGMKKKNGKTLNCEPSRMKVVRRTV